MKSNFNNSFIYFIVKTSGEKNLKSLPPTINLHLGSMNLRIQPVVFFQDCSLGADTGYSMYLWFQFFLLFHFPRSAADTFQLFCHLLATTLCLLFHLFILAKAEFVMYDCAQPEHVIIINFVKFCWETRPMWHWDFGSLEIRMITALPTSYFSVIISYYFQSYWCIQNENKRIVQSILGRWRSLLPSAVQPQQLCSQKQLQKTCTQEPFHLLYHEILLLVLGRTRQFLSLLMSH